LWLIYVSRLEQNKHVSVSFTGDFQVSQLRSKISKKILIELRRLILDAVGALFLKFCHATTSPCVRIDFMATPFRIKRVELFYTFVTTNIYHHSVTNHNIGKKRKLLLYN